jgi:ABC-type transporter Mla subunit MlaD
MDYCGVSYIAFETGEGSWRWRILTLNKGKIKIGGEAASREAAVEEAHQAIGEALRANAGPDHEEHLPQLADDVLHILHGARSLPIGKAVEALQPFLNVMRHRIPGADRFADASADAVSELVQSLEARGNATDDAWQAAIESTLSFANEAS